jgi:8-oxo-dGTP pyrophosphatase MutT (NUDIX family)
MKIDFPIPDDGKEHLFCVECHCDGVQKVIKRDHTSFLCPWCGAARPRVIGIHPNQKYWIDKDTLEHWHESVGVLLFNKKKEMLLFMRTSYPYALAAPAGHLDVGEEPIDAAKRELREETGLVIDGIELFSEEDVIGDECSSGADNHHWHLYVGIADPEQDVNLNDEGVEPVWLTREEALQREIVFPLRYFLEKYGNLLDKKNLDN